MRFGLLSQLAGNAAVCEFTSWTWAMLVFNVLVFAGTFWLWLDCKRMLDAEQWRRGKSG
jgi:hypothetical protein